MLAKVQDLYASLRHHSLTLEDVTHIFLSHHHVDHTRYVGLFPNAVVYDYSSFYRGDLWGKHDGDELEIAPGIRLIQTPGHTAECAALLVQTDAGNVVITHAWWFSDMTPEKDPLAEDQEALDKSRARILSLADEIIPGHGARFQVSRATR